MFYKRKSMKKKTEDKHEKKRNFIKEWTKKINLKEISVVKASKESKIPLSTLKRYVKKGFDADNYTGGRHTALSKEQEEGLISWCHEHNDLGHIITPKDFEKKG